MKTAKISVAKGTQIDDAISFVIARNRRYVSEVPVSDIFITTDDNEVVIDSLSYVMTDHAARQLAKYANIPAGCIKMPNDAAAMNFNRFLPNISGSVQLAVEGDRTIVGVLPTRFNPVNPETLATRVKEEVSDQFTLAEWWVDQTGMRFRYITPLELEPQLNDIVKIGVDVYDRENSEKGLGVLGNLYRLVCTNGAVAPEELMTRRLLSKLRWQEPKAQIDNVIESLDETTHNLLAMQMNFGILKDRPLILATDDEDERKLQLKPVLSAVGLTGDNYASMISSAFESEEQTMLGAYHAITRLGRDAAASDMKQKFESAGFKLLTRALTL